MAAGVIQGSENCPILFILFIAYINNYIPANTELEKYADDILTYIIGSHQNIGSSTLPQEIVNGIDK